MARVRKKRRSVSKVFKAVAGEHKKACAELLEAIKNHEICVK